MTRGCYIGRFQPYHEGHHAMVERIAAEVDELVLGIGSADQSHTVRDPFTAGERIMMITKATADLDLVTYAVPIEDLDRNSVWVSHVQSMSPRFDVAYSNNPLVVQLFQEAGVEVRQSPMFRREEFEGTEIRERMAEGRDWRELVPAAVEEVVDEIDGIERLQQIADSDANGEDDRWAATAAGEDAEAGTESASGTETATGTEPATGTESASGSNPDSEAGQDTGADPDHDGG